MFKEQPVFIPVPIAPTPISNPVVNQHPVATTDDEPIEDVDPVTLIRRSSHPRCSHGYILEEVREGV